jgi:hypothetical protein
MAPPAKPYNNGTWTVARFNSFIKSALRQASNRWGPKASIKKKARVERGMYRCEGYKRSPHVVPVSLGSGAGRKNNVYVDHIRPIIDPELGFMSWDDVINRMFCEEEGLQVLCKACHDAKTADERAERTEHGRRRRIQRS